MIFYQSYNITILFKLFVFQFVDDELGFILNYNIQHSTSLSIDLNANPSQVDFNLNFDCPEYPYYNSYVIARGWSETQNVYSFNTKVCTSLFLK